MKRTTVDVTEEAKAAAFDRCAAALPKGFEMVRLGTNKPGRVNMEIRGSRTDGHRSGVVPFQLDLTRQPLTDAVLKGLRTSCNAWAREPLVEGEAA